MELYHASKRAKRQIYKSGSICGIVIFEYRVLPLYRKFKTKIKRTIQKTWHIDVKNLRIK